MADAGGHFGPAHVRAVQVLAGDGGLDGAARPPRAREVSGAVAAAELRHLRLTLVAGFLHRALLDARDAAWHGDDNARLGATRYKDWLSRNAARAA